MQKRLTLLGSTGSIGDSTLDVVARHPERFSVYALTAHRNGDKLVEQCLRFQPEVAVVGDADTAASVAAKLRAAGCKTEVTYGPAGARRRVEERRLRYGGRGDRRRGRSRADARRRARRQTHPARQQGSAGHVRRDLHGRGARQRRRAAAGRQRAQRDFPVPAARSRAARRRLQDHSDRVGRPVPHARTGHARRRHAGRSLQASELGRWAARFRSTRPP